MPKNSAKKIASNNRWTNAHYDRINLALPLGSKDRIRAQAERAGKSVNAYIWTAILKEMEQEEREQSPVLE